MRVKLRKKETSTDGVIELSAEEIEAYKYIVFDGTSPYFLLKLHSENWVWQCASDLWCWADAEHPTKREAIDSYAKTHKLHVFSNISDMYNWLSKRLA